MPRYVESENCPDCGSPDYVTVHSDWAGAATIRLLSLRRCAECNMKYSPATPWWVSASAVGLGTLAAVGAVAIAWVLPAYLAEDERLARLGISVFFYLLACLGVAFALHGVARLLFPRPSPETQLPEDSQIHFDE